MGGMGVEQADPEIAGDIVEVAQKSAEGGGVGGKRFCGGVEFFGGSDGAVAFRAQVEAVVCRVLGDEIDFFDPFGDELGDFLNEVGLSAAAMGTAHARDDAETARMIAALRNLDVSEMVWSETKTRRGVIGNVDGAFGDI